MDAITLGPFTLALAHAAGLAGLSILTVGAVVLARRFGPLFMRWGMLAAIVAAVTARVAFVIESWPSFARAPASALYVWQGGFSWIAGAIAAVGITFWYFREHPSRLLWATVVLLLAAAPWLGYRAMIGGRLESYQPATRFSPFASGATTPTPFVALLDLWLARA